MRKFHPIIIPLFCIALLCSVVRVDASPETLEPQALADQALRLLDPSDAETALGRATCGAAVLMAVRAGCNDLPEKARGRLALLLQQGRPSTQAEYLSSSGRFRIHYDTSGIHAVDPADLDRNGVPDYVEEVGATADSAWSLQIDRFKFRPPPSDGTAGGGRDQYDIYLRELSRSGVYGNTYPENPEATTSTSYVEVDNNYTDHIYASKGKDGLHTALAHEFFHAVQFGYFSLFDAAWWQETTGVWMEDAAYPEVNDYYQYLPDYFKAPQVALDRFLFGFGDLHPYGSVVFIHNLYALFGVAPIRRGWENLSAKKAWKLDHIDEALSGGFDQVFPRFALWNYFTDARARPGYYPEASAYPSVKTRTVSVRPGLVLADSGRVDHLAADYLRFPSAGQLGGLSISLTLAPGARWKVFALLIQPGDVRIMEADAGGLRIPAWGQYDEVVVVPVCLSLTGSGFTYGVAAEVRSDVLKPARVVGDFDGNGVVDFTDFFAFAGGFGKGAASAGFDPRYDLNGDGAINFGDFFIFAAHFGESSG